MSPTQRFHCRHVLLPDGWREGVTLVVAASGEIAEVGPLAAGEPGIRLEGWVVPGMPDLHSHAFQRAMAGAAEHAGTQGDDFWSWRESMYALASRIDPDAQRAIAAQLFAELLEGGYTAVCEFHYVHHRPDGLPHQTVTAMGDAVCEAARSTGIGLTLLPTLYQVGGFDGRALGARQRRFGNTVDAFVALVEALRGHEDAQCRVGLAVHSLRAVPPDALADVFDAPLARDRPVHIHVAEQLREVDECLAERGSRPVAWMLDHLPVDGRWCAVHATHLSADERERLARAGAVAGLCPTTEANLGDGLFALREWRELGGTFGIGSDSNVGRSAVQELRWLEYGQRLRELRRNVHAPSSGGSTGLALWQDALRGGARACGRSIGALAIGHRADFVVLDADALALASRPAAGVLDAWLFDGDRSAIDEVYVGGRCVVRAGRHVRADAIERDYRAALARLASDPVGA
jgi:formimidoylglutamate deiminase